MKRKLIIIGGVVLLAGLLIFLVAMNAFGSKDWIMKKTNAIFNEEHTGGSANSPDNSSANEKNTIEVLFKESGEKVNKEEMSSDAWKYLQKSLEFPQGSYLDRSHIEEVTLLKDSKGYSYDFRIIMPSEKVDEFIETLEAGNCFVKDNPTRQWTDDTSVDPEDIMYSYSGAFSSYIDGFRTTGCCWLTIVDAGDECIVLIEAV